VTTDQPANAQLRILIHETIHGLGVGYAEYGRARAEVIVDTAIFSSCQARSRCWAGSSVGDRCHRGAPSAEEVSGTGESHEWCLGLRDLRGLGGELCGGGA